MSEMMKLAEIVEGLEGPCRKTDAGIAYITHWRWDGWEEGDVRIEERSLEYVIDRVDNGHNSIWQHLPRYTASLDAAMQLVAKGAMRRSGDSAIGLMGTFFCDIVLEDGRDFHAIANSESCAIVSAALKARAHLEGE